MSWIDIGTLDDIPVRGARRVTTAMGCVAVFRTGTSEVFAVGNTCPHRGGPLSEGIVHDRRVTCPLHNTVFDLSTGEGTDGHRIPTYTVRVDDGRLLLDGDALVRRPAA